MKELGSCTLQQLVSAVAVLGLLVAHHQVGEAINVTRRPEQKCKASEANKMTHLQNAEKSK